MTTQKESTSDLTLYSLVERNDADSPGQRNEQSGSGPTAAIRGRRCKPNLVPQVASHDVG
jgi:hypothetical protein